MLILGQLQLEMTPKQAITLHQLYSLGADIIFAVIDPNSIKSAAGFIALNMSTEDLHDLRDKMSNLARQITPETYKSLGITKVEL